MPNLRNHWLIALEEKNKVGKELINEIRSLHFSIRMITKLVSVRDDSLPVEGSETDSGLIIYQNSAQDANSLNRDLQVSLTGAALLVENFVIDASKLVRYVESYVLVAPPHEDLKVLVDMCFALDDIVHALEGWQNNILNPKVVLHHHDS